MERILIVLCFVMSIAGLCLGAWFGKTLGARTVIKESLCWPISNEQGANSIAFKFKLDERYTGYICTGKHHE